MKSHHRILAMRVTTFVVAVLLSARAVRAQSADVNAVPTGVDVPVVLSGVALPHPSALIYHILRANTEAGQHAALYGLVGQSKTEAAARVKALAGLPKPGFYPADLSFFGGSVLLQANSLNVYYNCADSSCFGKPEQFQTDLAKSKFIHVVDQYVGSKTNNRYPLSTTLPVHLNGTSTSLSYDDIVSLVTSAVSSAAPGHIFHIFLPQGVDTCLDQGNTVCYSPDNPSTFAFCGYHSSVSIGGADVFFTVIPYEDVQGCMAPPPNPNGALVDFTNSVLSHELFETITDPLGDAWIADSSPSEAGSEIGDICEGSVFSYVLVQGRTYQTQLEYSNARHACVVTP
jgi:hypothetical protein